MGLELMTGDQEAECSTYCAGQAPPRLGFLSPLTFESLWTTRGVENTLIDQRLGIISLAQTTPRGTKWPLAFISSLIKKENSSFKHATIFNPDWWSIRLLDFLPPLQQQSLPIYLWLLPMKPSTFQRSSEDLYSKSALTLGIGIHVSLPQSIHTLPFE